MGLRMEDPNGGSLKNKIFRGGGGHENSIYSRLPKRRAWTVYRFKRRLGKNDEMVFLRGKGLIPQCTHGGGEGGY